jgi:glycosidase
MKIEAIRHRSSREFIIPQSRTSLSVLLTAAREDLAYCHIVYWKRSDPRLEARKEVPLKLAYRNATTDDFRITLEFDEITHYVKYFFIVADTEGSIRYLTNEGIVESVPSKGFFEYLYTNTDDVFCPPLWARGIVWYQIFPERFARGINGNASKTIVDWNSKPTRENFLGGNLVGIINKMDYLMELGVECLYLNPIFRSDFNHKYAPIDYFQIDPDFGTIEDLIRLVGLAHMHEMRVVLDGVFNHVGCDFPQFSDVKQRGFRSPYVDWFFIHGFPLTGEPLNYECVGDYRWMPKLNTANPEVRGMIANVMEYWIREAGIDGWRLDVADEVDSSTWVYCRSMVKRTYPEALLVGETWGDGFRLVGNGDQMDTIMNYLFRDAAIDFFAQRSIGAVEFDHRINTMLSRYHEVVAGTLYNLISSHDTARFLTIAGGDVGRLRMAVAFQMLFIGSPAIYYGDEIGMEGENDPDCRAGMNWGYGLQQQKLLEFHRMLIAIRKHEQAIRLGNYRTVLAREDGIFVFSRTYGNEEILVFMNNGIQDRFVELDMAVGVQYADLVDNAAASYEAVASHEKSKQTNKQEVGRLEVPVQACFVKILKRMEGKEHDGK